MSAVMFGLTYVGSWLLMGLGVILAFRLVASLRQGAILRGTAQERMMPALGLVRAALVALVVVVSLGVIYAGAHTVYSLMIVP